MQFIKVLALRRKARKKNTKLWIREEIKALTDGAEPERIWNVDALTIIDKYAERVRKMSNDGSTL